MQDCARQVLFVTASCSVLANAEGISTRCFQLVSIKDRRLDLYTLKGSRIEIPYTVLFIYMHPRSDTPSSLPFKTEEASPVLGRTGPQ